MSIWTRWLKLPASLSRKGARRPARRKSAGKRPAHMPNFELLEDRTTPSVAISALHLGTSTGAIDYDYTVGNKVVPTGTVDAGKFYDLVVTRSDGSKFTAVARTATPSNGILPTTIGYTIQAGDPASTATAYKMTLHEYANATTTTVAKTSSKSFYVAKPVIYSNSALTPAFLQSYFTAGTTAYVTVAGLLPGKSDWSTTWLTPSGAIAAANTANSDRPDVNSKGVLAVGTSGTSAATYLQYAPRTTTTGTDLWNLQSKYETKPSATNSSFTTAPEGTWQLKLQKDTTHFVTLTVFTVDRTAPTVNVTSPPSPVTINASSYTIAGTVTDTGDLTPGNKVTVQVYSGLTPVGSPKVLTGGSGSFSISVPLAAADGPNNFTVRATDAAGNVGMHTVPTITKDSTAPPAPSVDSPADVVTVNANTYPISGHAVDNSLVQVWVDANNNGIVDVGDSVAGSQQLTGSGSTITTYSISVPLTQNADNHFVVTASDNVPNRSGAVLVPTITEDSVAPNPPTVDSPSSPDVTADLTYTIEGTAEANSLVRVWVNNNGVKGALVGSQQLTDDDMGVYAITVNLASSTDNKYFVTATDAAGNESATTTVPTITQNSSAPPPPFVSSPGGPVSTNQATYPIAGTATAGTLVKVWKDANNNGVVDGGDTQVGSQQLATLATAYSISVSLSSNQINDFLVTATYTATGMQSSATDVPDITQDSIAPAAPSTPDLDAASDTGSSSTDNITADNTPSFSGTAEAGSMVTIYSDGVAVGTGSADDSGNWSVTASALSDGAHSITAKATDDAGNTGIASGALSVTIDATAPAAPSTPDLTAASDSGSSNTDNVTSVTTPTFTGTAEAGSAVKIYSDGNLVGSGTATGGGYTITVSALSDGTHSITATATDTAGNVSAASGALSVTIDTAAPAAPSTPDLTDASDTGNSNTDNVTKNNAPTFAGTAEAGSTVKIFDGVTLVGSGTATGGSYSITTSPLADGVHSIKATATDAAGNTSALSGALSVTIDTAAPAAPSTPDLTAASDTGSSNADNVTANTTPTFTGTAEAGSTVTIYSDGVAVGSGTATGGSYSVTVSTLTDGTHAITAKATDAAGNTGAASGALSVVIDTAAPAAPSTPDLTAASDSGSSNTDNVTSVTTPTFTGTAEAGSTVKIYDGATLVGSGTATGGSYSVTVSTLTDGTHSITATATDAAGNTSVASGALSVVIDTTAPAAPSTPDLDAASDSGSSNSDNVTSVTTPTFTGTAEAGSTVKIYDGATLVGSGTATGGNYSVTVSTLTDGTHSITATATDAAGNTGAASGALSVTIDTAAPAAPSTPDLTAASDTGSSNADNVTANTTPTFTGTAEAGSTVTIYSDGNPVGSGTAAGGSYSVTTSALSNGTHSITAKATDAAGNTGAASGALSVVIDTTAPAAPSTPDLDAASDSGSSNSDNVTSVTTPTFTGTAEAGSTVTIYSDGNPVGSGTAAGGSYSVTTSALSDGTHSITAKATDAAGNTSAASGALSVTIDTTAPAAPPTPDLDPASDSGSSDTDNTTNDTTPTFTGTAEAGSAVTIYSDGVAVGSGTAAGGNYSITTSALSDGTHSITAKATDAAGNTSAASGALSVTIDTTAPAAPSTPDLDAASDTGVSNSDNVTSDNTPTFNGTAEAGSTVTIYSDGTPVGSDTATGGSYSITVSHLDDGAHSITAKATDAAGNTSAASGALTVIIITGAPAAPSTPDLTAASDTGASNSDNVTSDNTPTFTGTAQAGTTVTIYSDGVAVGSGLAAIGTYSITTSILSDGTHSITATATDAADNTSDFSGALSVVIDTAAPAAPSTPVLDSGSDSGTTGDNVTNVATPTFTGTAEAGSTVTIYSDGNPVGSGTATGGSYSVTVSTLTDGAHSITATATDTAGNVSAASGALSVTIDTTAPAAPSTPDLAAASDSGSSNSDNVTSVTTPTFTGTAEAGSTVKIYDGATLVGSGTATGGSYNVTVSTLTDGTHSITATATDTAGNVSAASGALSVTIDTAAPAAPSTPDLAAASDSGSSDTDNVTSVATPTFTGTAEAGSTVTIYSDGNPVGSGTATGGSYSVTTSALSDGTHSITATATDTAGNVSAASGALSVTIDTAAPAAPSTPDLTAASDSGSSDTDNVTSVATPTFTGTAEAGSTVKIYDGATLVGSGTATGGSYNVTVSTLTDGTHSITATATDTAGNVSAASGALSVTIDTAAPAAPSTPDLTAASDSGSSNTDNVTSVATPTFTGTAEAGSAVKVYDGATVLGTTTADGGGNWTFTVASALSDGTHAITATATDTAGNVSAASGALSVTIDTAAPAAPSTPDLTDASDTGSSNTDNVTKNNTPTFTGTAEASSTLTVYDGATVLGTTTADGSGNWTFTAASALADGTHAITAKATDAAGNTSVVSDALSVVIDTSAPVVKAGGNITVDSGDSWTRNNKSFTDSGPSYGWTATVDYGDGSGGDLTLSGQTFNLSHTWYNTGTEPVTFTVWVYVTDLAGNVGKASFTVTVNPV